MVKNSNYKVFKDRERESSVAFLNDNYIKPGCSILDIGGASGSLLNSISKEVPIDGTVLDTDADLLRYGSEKYPHIKFIEGWFPNNVPDEKYDIVTMQALFPHLADWKRSILTMSKLSKKYINFSALTRVNGTTVTDRDVSYFYYLDTGIRTPQVICNIFEIVNFLCVQEVRAKTIQFCGNATMRFPKMPPDMLEDIKQNSGEFRDYVLSFKNRGHVFRCDLGFRIFHGNFMVELFSEEENPKRVGGLGPDHKEDIPGYEFFRPEIRVDLNGKQFFYHKDEDVSINAAIVWGGML